MWSTWKFVKVIAISDAREELCLNESMESNSSGKWHVPGYMYDTIEGVEFLRILCVHTAFLSVTAAYL